MGFNSTFKGLISLVSTDHFLYKVLKFVYGYIERIPSLTVPINSLSTFILNGSQIVPQHLNFYKTAQYIKFPS